MKKNFRKLGINHKIFGFNWHKFIAQKQGLAKEVWDYEAFKQAKESSFNLIRK